MSDQDGAISSAKLYAKMAMVMGKLGRLEKSGFNAFHKYEYVTAATVSDTFRELFADVGLAFFASTKNVQVLERRYLVEYEYVIACTETGATHVCSWFGEAMHTTGANNTPDDKALNKAATTAQKYFLLATFVGSAGDADVDNDDQQGGQKKPKQQNNQQRQQQPPPAPQKPNIPPLRIDQPAPSPAEVIDTALADPNAQKPFAGTGSKRDQAYQRTNMQYNYGHRKHFDNLVDQLQRDDKVHAAMSVDEIVAAIDAHYAAKQKAG